MYGANMIPTELKIEQDSVASPEYNSDTQREDIIWRRQWEEILAELLKEDDVWGVVGISPAGEAVLFDASLISIQRCAAHSIEVLPVRAEVGDAV